VWFSGELDASSADDVGAAMTTATSAGGAVLIDLTRLTFVDSDGIRALLGVAARLSGRGCLILHNPTPHVAKVFEIVVIAGVPSIHLLDARHGDIAVPDARGRR
jgi:anti-sigma B factor antagonist